MVTRPTSPETAVTPGYGGAVRVVLAVVGLAVAALLVAPAEREPAPAPEAPEHHVLAISVDGLNVAAIRQLGPEGTPTLHRLLDEGAGTLDARTEYEQTVTLPNHTGMVTGRRIAAKRGGHGVTWNEDRPGTTVQRAAGHPVASIFSVVHRAGGDTALYSTKEKFEIFERSWPRAVDTTTIDERHRRLVAAVRADLLDGAATFTFLHVSLPDQAGHDHGGMSEQYADAVRRTDRQLARVLDAVSDGPDGTDGITVVLTSDHGFADGQTSHSARTDPANFTVPFLVWGAGVEPADLYELNPGRRAPGDRRPSYAAGRQPVRNGDLANLAATLLGLEPVPGSEFGVGDPLRAQR